MLESVSTEKFLSTFCKALNYRITNTKQHCETRFLTAILHVFLS